MNKTLQRTFSPQPHIHHAKITPGYEGKDIVVLMQVMAPVLQAAEEQLLQPRDEAVARLLQLAKGSD